jgi:hypothetical protein
MKKLVSVVAAAMAVVSAQSFAAVSSVVPAGYTTDIATVSGDVVAIGAGLITLAVTALGVKWVKGTLLS